MKKKLILLSSLAFALSAQAMDITEWYISGNICDNLNFLGLDGKSYMTTNQSAQVRNLTKVGAAYVGTISVASGVNAYINLSTTPVDTRTSPANCTFRFGGSAAGTVDGSAAISGAGMTSSTLHFYGINFDTGMLQTQPRRASQKIR